MTDRRRITRADLPQFAVSSVEQGRTAQDGQTEWILRGSLRHADGMDFDSWCWLLAPGRGIFTATRVAFSGEEADAAFSTWDQDRPAVEGVTLACLSAAHQANHIWMVEEGPDAWTTGIFQASDAVAEYVIGTDGKTYRKWTKAGEDTSGLSAHPGGDQSTPWIIPGGWDHEHCAICWNHIDPGDRFYHYAEWNTFLCASCFEAWVVPRDIGFALPQG